MLVCAANLSKGDFNEKIDSRSFDCGMCLLTISMGTRAQDAPQGTQHDRLLAGLSTADGSYMLSDLEKGPKSVGIVSSTANLKPHVGHKIEITGTPVVLRLRPKR